jgi:hypothetical protein
MARPEGNRTPVLAKHKPLLILDGGFRKAQACPGSA